MARPVGRTGLPGDERCLEKHADVVRGDEQRRRLRWPLPGKSTSREHLRLEERRIFVHRERIRMVGHERHDRQHHHHGHRHPADVAAQPRHQIIDPPLRRQQERRDQKQKPQQGSSPVHRRHEQEERDVCLAVVGKKFVGFHLEIAEVGRHHGLQSKHRNDRPASPRSDSRGISGFVGLNGHGAGSCGRADCRSHVEPRSSANVIRASLPMDVAISATTSLSWSTP